MTAIEDVSDSMNRSMGSVGCKFYSVFDGKLFWYVNLDLGTVYDENQNLTRDEEVNNFVKNALKEEGIL